MSEWWRGASWGILGCAAFIFALQGALGVDAPYPQVAGALLIGASVTAFVHSRAKREDEARAQWRAEALVMQALIEQADMTKVEIARKTGVGFRHLDQAIARMESDGRVAHRLAPCVTSASESRYRYYLRTRIPHRNPSG